MPHAIRVHQVGDASVLKYEPVEVSAPGPGQVQLRHTAIGLNFIDVYQRTGLYPQPLPFIPGQEGAGVVTVLGEGVTSLRVGQRVAYAGLSGGGYSELRNAPADRLLAIPEQIPDQIAASIMLKGMTAEYLLRRCYPVRPGEAVLIHAAAGGVGLLATQWARHLGAVVIGAVGRREKAEFAAPNCDHVIVLSEGPWVEKVKALTAGKGVSVVYDSVGKDTLLQSLDALAPRGTLVSFGQSSGKAAPLDLMSLGGPRSLYVTRPTMGAYVATRAELEQSAGALFAMISTGKVVVKPPRTFKLKDVQSAHRALEGRETTGSVVLLPGD